MWGAPWVEGGGWTGGEDEHEQVDGEWVSSAAAGGAYSLLGRHLTFNMTSEMTSQTSSQ